MKAKTKKTSKKNWALPGKSLSLEEFKEGIEKAQEGPFYTVEESRKIIAEWRKQRKSQ